MVCPVHPTGHGDLGATRSGSGMDAPLPDKGRKLCGRPGNGFYYACVVRRGKFLVRKAIVYSRKTWRRRSDKNGRPVGNPGQEPCRRDDKIWPASTEGNKWMSPRLKSSKSLLYFNAREESRVLQNDAPEFSRGVNRFSEAGGGGGARFERRELGK